VGRRLSVVFAFFLMAASSAVPSTVHHPLDALTPDEYWTVYRVLREAGHVQEPTVFTSVLFHEPPKKEVLNWKAGDPISREADVVLFDQGHSYAAVVDISAQKVESYTELKDAQAPLTDDERHAVEGAIKKDQRIVDALKKCGITDLKVVTCYVEPAGYVAS
jgi:primary-amine oxidase